MRKVEISAPARNESTKSSDRVASKTRPEASSSPMRATLPVMCEVYVPTAKKPLALIAPATPGRIEARMAGSMMARFRRTRSRIAEAIVARRGRLSCRDESVEQAVGSSDPLVAPDCRICVEVAAFAERNQAEHLRPDSSG